MMNFAFWLAGITLVWYGFDLDAVQGLGVTLVAFSLLHAHPPTGCEHKADDATTPPH